MLLMQPEPNREAISVLILDESASDQHASVISRLNKVALEKARPGSWIARIGGETAAQP
jgi:hypothetical protein